MKKLLYLIFGLMLIQNAEAISLINQPTQTDAIGLYENNLTGVIWDEAFVYIDGVILQNVSYIDEIRIDIGAGAYPNFPSGKKIYLRLYSCIGGVCAYETGTFFTITKYYDLGTPIFMKFPQVDINHNLDYAIGIYSDIDSNTNGDIYILGASQKMKWQTSSSQLLWMDDSYVQNFSKRTGEELSLKAIKIYVYGQTILPSEPVETPIPTGSEPITDLPIGGCDFYTFNSTAGQYESSGCSGYIPDEDFSGMFPNINNTLSDINESCPDCLGNSTIREGKVKGKIGSELLENFGYCSTDGCDIFDLIDFLYSISILMFILSFIMLVYKFWMR